MEKEREALSEGKGYWDMISEHISEAFNPKSRNAPAADQDLSNFPPSPKDHESQGNNGGK